MSPASRVRLGDEIDLVDEDAVGRHNLIDRLVVDAVEARIVEMAADVLGIDQRHDAVEIDLPRDVVVDEERGGDRIGIGKSARLHQNVIEFLAPAHELAENADEVGPHAADAANAAVCHLEDFLFGGEHQAGIDVDLAEFVFDHGDPVAVPFGENVIEQRRLSRSEKSRKDGDRNRPGNIGLFARHALSMLTPACSLFIPPDRFAGPLRSSRAAHRRPARA